jgi:hypothetical protein
MSAFASFHLIDNADLDALLKNAWPKRIESVQRRWFFFTRRSVTFEDPLPWFLDNRGEELAAFQYSGFIFQDLEKFLNRHDASIYSDFRKPDLDEIAAYRHGTLALYSEPKARETLSQLDAVPWDLSNYLAFIESGESALGEETEPQAKTALTHFKSWLGAVGTGTTGVFTLV